LSAFGGGSETPSELTLASNAPNVSRQNPLHL
jgi:hypothetical protein